MAPGPGSGELAMEFRWLILLTMWTALAGPILARPAARTGARQTRNSSQPTFANSGANHRR
jgi:hypothetical protein